MITPENDRKPRLHRLLRLAQLLRDRAHRIRLEQYQTEFGISKRTFFRDLSLLRTAGLTIDYFKKNETYVIRDPVVSPLETMSVEELGKLMAILWFTKNSPTNLAADAGDLFKQIDGFVLSLDFKTQSKLRETIRDTILENESVSATNQHHSAVI